MSNLLKPGYGSKVSNKKQSKKLIRQLAYETFIQRIIDRHTLDYDVNHEAFADIGNEANPCYVPVISQPFIQMLHLYVELFDIELIDYEFSLVLEYLCEYAIDHGDEIDVEYTLEGRGYTMADIKNENGCGNCATPEVPVGIETCVTQPVNPWDFNLECGCWDGWYDLSESSDNDGDTDIGGGD